MDRIEEPSRPSGEGFTLYRREDPAAGAIRAELDRILLSRTFARPERPGLLLKFLVERTLEGNANKLSEFVLANQLFNRKPSFDPASDPIVRVEAGRLRRKLQEYYQTEGSQDPILIDLPNRTYVPVFRHREDPARQDDASKPSPPVAPGAVFTEGRRPKKALLIGVLGIGILGAYWALSVLGSTFWSRGLPFGAGRTLSAAPQGARSLLVLPLSDLSPNHDHEYFCDGLTEELNEHLNGIEGLAVLARSTAYSLKGKTDDIREIGRRLNVRFVLEGSVRKSGGRLRISTQLIDTANGYLMWSQSFNREIRDPLKVEDEIAREVAAAVRTRLEGLGGGSVRRPLD